jgi:P-type Na+/K+ transporter
LQFTPFPQVRPLLPYCFVHALTEIGIAIIPESLIAVLTITFVVGMTQMRRRKVLTRKLSALEALGGITNICSDKTGTLTQGQMVTRKAWIPGIGIYTVSNNDNASNPTSGVVSLGPAKTKAEADIERIARQEELDQRRSKAAIKFDEPLEKMQKYEQRTEEQPEPIDTTQKTPDIVPAFGEFLQSAALCNLATVRQDKEGLWQTTGDPTEIALQVFAQRFDYGKKTLEQDRGWKQVAEYPFDSSVKRMSVVYRSPNNSDTVIFAKGAVERIVDLCDRIRFGDEESEMTSEMKETVIEQMTMLAEQGLRVLAISRRTWSGGFSEHSNIPREEVEQNLTLLGLAGLYDPPRTETKDAVRGERNLAYFSAVCS